MNFPVFILLFTASLALTEFSTQQPQGDPLTEPNLSSATGTTNFPIFNTEISDKNLPRKSNPRRLLQADSCSFYSDCYNCTLVPGCAWCDSRDCEVPGCRQGFSGNTQWWYGLRYCTANENMKGVCPDILYQIDGDYSQRIVLPPVGKQMPPNGFCFWQIYNTRQQTVTIDITSLAVSLLFVFRFTVAAATTAFASHNENL